MLISLGCHNFGEIDAINSNIKQWIWILNNGIHLPVFAQTHWGGKEMSQHDMGERVINNRTATVIGVPGRRPRSQSVAVTC